MKYNVSLSMLFMLATTTIFAPLTERILQNIESDELVYDQNYLATLPGINILCNLTRSDKIIFRAIKEGSFLPIATRCTDENEIITTKNHSSISIPKSSIHDQDPTIVAKTYPSQQDPKHILYIFLWDQQHTITPELTNAEKYALFLITPQRSHPVQYLNLDARTIVPDARIRPDILEIIQAHTAQQAQRIKQSYH